LKITIKTIPKKKKNPIHLPSQYAMVRVTEAERAMAATSSPLSMASRIPLKGHVLHHQNIKNVASTPFAKTRATFKAAMGVISQATTAAKRTPKSCEVDLAQKLGMVITSSAVVGSVNSGGQAEKGGIRVGAKILSVGDTMVLSLDGIKEAVGKLKSEGISRAQITFEPPSSSVSGVTRTLLVSATQ
jgi:S1-C subfamily serine protease